MIKARVIKQKKHKKLMRMPRKRKLRHLSTNSEVAAVNKAGKIIAKSEGTCRIHAFAHNGVRKTIWVIVK